MARIDDIERRLLNWARWKAGATFNPQGYAQAQLEERVDGEGWDSHQAVPTHAEEAAQTERAVCAINQTLKQAVTVFYLGAGGAARKARQLGCSERTMYARIEQAHPAISYWLTEAAAMAKRERERVERLQRLAVAQRRC